MTSMNIKKLLCILASLVLCVTMLSTAVYAEDPYTSYNYNAWQTAVASQNGYIVSRTVTGLDMGLDQLSDPDSPFFISEDEPSGLSDAKDFFLSDNNEFFIVDTGNNRIIRTDIDFNLIACYKTFTGSSLTTETTDENGNTVTVELTTLNAPNGIYVDEDDIMYIADKDNQRIVKCGLDCKIITEYVKPDSELYATQSFYCTKVLVDAAKNVYVICPAVNKGAIMFSSSGSFMGYYGANRVEVTAEAIKNKLWRKFASDDQIASMTNITPVEYANFDIDDEGFIYTVTEVADVSTDAVKKMNPAGYNILESTTNAADITFGDQQSITYSGTTYSTRLTDITVGDNGVINILDYTSGRIFQYDKECNLLFIFGCDQEGQEGGFDNPNAIECYGDLVYILDGRNNDITVFEETLFGEYVHEAVRLYNDGLYEDALDLWYEVIKRDGNFTMAYSAIGKALLNQGDYKEAMKYFKIAFNDEDYDRAFEAWRQDILRENFTLMIVAIIVLVIVIWVISILQKKGKIPKKLIAKGLGWVGRKIAALAKKIVELVKGGKKK